MPLCPPSTEEDDTAARADELCALQAIYGDEFVGAGSADGDASTLSFAIPDAAAQLQLTLRVHLPASYPSQDPPICELACDCVAPDVLAALAAELEGMFAPGARGGGSALACVCAVLALLITGRCA